MVTTAPSYWLGFITKNGLVNVFVDTGSGRYTMLIIFIAVWALLMAIMVSVSMAWWSTRSASSSKALGR